MLVSPFDLPEGILLLITDELSSPADFLLHKYLITHAKGPKSSRTIIISVSEEIARWRAIATKSNVNIAQLLDAKLLKFVDVLAHVQPRSSDATFQFSLRPIVENILPTLNSDKGPLLIILDDITSLQWIGFSLLDITRFSRSLRALCLQAKATLIIRHHNITPDQPDDLFRHLVQICTYHMEVCPLSSGRSGGVSGAIALHAGLSTPPEEVASVPRTSAIQYRMTDTGPIFFNRGTAESVL